MQHRGPRLRIKSGPEVTRFLRPPHLGHAASWGVGRRKSHSTNRAGLQAGHYRSQTGARSCWSLWGRFRTARAQRGHSANYCGVHPGKSPAHHPSTEACMIPFKTASGVQNSGPWDPWATGGKKQPTFRTARAQRTVRPLTVFAPHRSIIAISTAGRGQERGGGGARGTTATTQNTWKMPMPAKFSGNRQPIQTALHTKAYDTDAIHTIQLTFHPTKRGTIQYNMRCVSE